MSDKPLTEISLNALFMASRFAHNDGWMSADDYNTDVTIAFQTGKALNRRGLMETHPSGFAYRITDAGRQYVQQHWTTIKSIGSISHDAWKNYHGIV